MISHNSKSIRVSYLLAITLIPLTMIIFSQRLFAEQEMETVRSTHTVSGITITVNTADDELNSDGDCSLREALQAANTNTAVDACPAGSGWDTIQIPAGTYQLSLTGADEDSNATGDFDILESVDIVGAGSSTTILDGMMNDRVLHVDPADAGITFNLHNISVINGKSALGGGIKADNGATFIRNSHLRLNEAFTRGGAIYIDYGSLHIISSTIENNISSSEIGYGGGVYNNAASAKLVDSTVISNTAYQGGGIYMQSGFVSLETTQVLSNVARTAPSINGRSLAISLPPGSSAIGGGIYANNGQVHIDNDSEIAYNRSADNGGGVYGRADVLFSMQNSSVHHNTSGNDGGGLYLQNVQNIQNSTIEYNVAEKDGGGIYHEYDLILENSTVAHNQADEGGGNYQYEYGSLIISNTVVYSNTADDGGGVYQYAMQALLLSTASSKKT